uniref:Uncharacterized protein n=1 Tax=Anguilla anguilla TaxID=7936 RepID=A0A0E9VIZ2_ANGAN
MDCGGKHGTLGTVVLWLKTFTSVSENSSHTVDPKVAKTWPWRATE